MGMAHVIIEVRRRDGMVRDWLVCDFFAGSLDDGAPDLLLMVPCPVCHLKHGRVGESMLLRQSSHVFSLDSRRRGERWANPNDPGEVYVLAGEVTTHQRIWCARCRTTYRIEASVMQMA